MRKAASVAIAAMMAVTIVGCASSEPQEEKAAQNTQSETQDDKSEKTKETKVAGLVVTSPEDWKYKVAAKLNSFYLQPPCGGTLYASVGNFDDGTSVTKEMADSQAKMIATEFFKGAESDEADIDIDAIEKFEKGDAVMFCAPMSSTIKGIDLSGTACIMFIGERYASIMCAIPNDADPKYADDLRGVVDNLYFEYDSNATFAEQDKSTNAQSPSSENKETEQQAKPSTPSATTSQTNALRSASSYLRVMGFSYSGLIEQLEYEGYSTEDATYAADNCGADWNEQAAKSAKSYMDVMGFSRAGLIEQLEYEGYTPEQAAYGADSVGL